MTSIKIVTDSSCTIETEVRDRLHIHVVPLSVMIDGVLYRDDDDLSGARFMEMMAEAKELPKTSQPPIGEFVELYDELGKDGSQVISIHMTQGLSGTVEAARQASNLSKTDVTILDSDTIDQGLAFQVIRAAEMALAGAELTEILAKVKEISDNTKLFIGLSSLNNLVKGGRISRATGLLSSFLNMRIIMDVDHSELIPVVKGRGNKTFTNWFANFKEELTKLPNVKQIGISHADAWDLAEEFKKELEALFPGMHIPVLQTTPIIATHTGKGAFAIMYYQD